MSVADRVADAAALSRAGRVEGALLMLLTAVAGSALKRLPADTPSRWKPGTPMLDGERFQLFLGGRISFLLLGDDGEDDLHGGLITLRFQGQEYSLPRLLYALYRCPLVHESGLPHGVFFGELPEDARGLHLSMAGFDIATWQQGDDVLGLSVGWMTLLYQAVITAPCNEDEFGPSPTHQASNIIIRRG